MNKKIVVYTALFGNYSGIIEQPRLKGVVYICYTDQEITSKSWKIIKVIPPVAGDNTRSNRYYKLLPHKHLKDYDISVYIDANFLIVKDFVSIFKKKLENNLMVCFDHNKTILDPRNCIYQEYDELMKIATQLGVERDNTTTMTQQIEYIKKDKYPPNNGLISAGVIARRHNNKKVINLMELWWDFVQNRSKRDQLSFNYCARKLNFEEIEYLKYDIRTNNPWFRLIEHKLDFTNDIRNVKRLVFFERLIGIKSLKFTLGFYDSILHFPLAILLHINLPRYYRKITNNRLSMSKYRHISYDIFKNNLTKSELKNKIGSHYRD